MPDTLHDVDFIARDSKRFPDTGGWGYAQSNYDAASDTFAPEVSHGSGGKGLPEEVSGPGVAPPAW